MKYGLVVVLLIAGCSSAPEQYRRLPWAKMPLEQAEAECYAEMQRYITMGKPTCMKSKGWEEL